MAGRFEYIDHSADIAVRVTADSIEDLFITSAQALNDCLVSGSSFGNTEQKRINLNEYSVEELLVSFLNELNYFFTVRKWLMRSVVSIKVEEYQEIWQLKSIIEGTTEVSYTAKEEIKAVTFHQMEIKSLKGNFETVIVFNI